jgi:pimeloyl-ACP methyl ester carboxylesterase
MVLVLPLTVTVSAPDGPVRVRVWPADERGAIAGPVLLACHGWTDSAEVFGPLSARLRRRWTVVAPDAPAHGGTPLRDGEYVVAEHATSVLAVLEALPRVAGVGGRPVVALGHSMGALTAARVAAARPDVVRALVLEDPARTTPRRAQSTARMKAWLAGLQSGSHDDRVAWVRANHPDWPRAELGPWARSKAEVDAAHLDRHVDWGEPLPAVLADVPCPVLLVRGEPARGGIVSATAARRCVAACAGGADVLTLDAGHCPRREASRAFTGALTAVLGAARQERPVALEPRRPLRPRGPLGTRTTQASHASR